MFSVFLLRKSVVTCEQFLESSYDPNLATEAAFCKFSTKLVFLKILRNSQKNTCAEVSFWLKLQYGGLQLYQKKRLWYRYFPINFCESFESTFFKEHFPATAFIVITWNNKLLSFSFVFLTFSMLIDCSLSLCFSPTCRVITAMEIHFDSYKVWVSGFFNQCADVRRRKSGKTPVNVLCLVEGKSVLTYLN